MEEVGIKNKEEKEKNKGREKESCLMHVTFFWVGYFCRVSDSMKNQ